MFLICNGTFVILSSCYGMLGTVWLNLTVIFFHVPCPQPISHLHIHLPVNSSIE